MKKIVVLGLLFYWVLPVFAQEEESKQLPPLDPEYMGVHGMVLVNHNSDLLASHLPMYRKPHNAQVIYKIDSKEQALIYLVRDADMVTIEPETFNLQRLIRGEKITLKANVYVGHFERGGMLTYKDVEISFAEQVYLRMLEDLPPATKLQRYDAVPLNNGSRLLVHQIQSAPSYDQLILLYDDVSCLTQFYASSGVPKEGEAFNKLSFCGSMKPLYFETHDFAEKY